jgi:hypothetical protein
MRVLRKTYKKYAGALIVGQHEVQVSTRAAEGEHMARAFYLTAMLEASKWGTIQSYDGAAMSGGPMHWVAVLPKTESQGPLFKLLRRLEMEAQGLEIANVLDVLWDELAGAGFYVARDGVLRDIRNGKAITGRQIRNEFTPGSGPRATRGKVGARDSKSWKQAERWAKLFYQLLSADWTWDAQMDHSIEYLIRGAAKEELYCYQYWLPELESPERIHLLGSTEDGPKISDPVDFAMCVYHSFTPNAPGMARVVLKRVISAYESWLYKRRAYGPRGVHETRRLVEDHDMEGDVFAKLLIKKMGTTQYGNWHDRPHQSGARYDRARKYAKASDLFRPEYFEGKDALMPMDLKK